jgi:hypothetical protein
MESTQNGHKRQFNLPTFGCEGCERRKDIMGAGNWRLDVALILFAIAAALVMWRVKIA